MKNEYKSRVSQVIHRPNNDLNAIGNHIQKLSDIAGFINLLC